MRKKMIVTNADINARLDKFSAEHIPGVSRTKLKHMIENGLITVGGLKRKASYRLRPDETVSIVFDDGEKQQTLALFPKEIPILFEDDHIIVVDKPGHLVTHPPHAGYSETLVNALLYMKKRLYAGKEPLRPGIVHRLDKETSGVMVLAKTPDAYHNLIQQFKDRCVYKEYRAIVWGYVCKERIRVQLPLARQKRNRLKMKVSFHRAKNAITDLHVIRRLAQATYCKLIPRSGRMHQLRVHLNFLGFPIAGDTKYGRKDSATSLLLHAHILQLRHPQTGRLLLFRSRIPERFRDFIEKHG